MFYLPAIFWSALSLASMLFPLMAGNNLVGTSKKESPPVSKISYSSSGGRSGNYESLAITKDSVIYVQARRGDEKTIQQKTARSEWSRLTHSINLRDFNRIKSDPGYALYDGVDITITIETGKEKHTIVNGSADTVHYKRISSFTGLLQKKLAGLRKKVIW